MRWMEWGHKKFDTHARAINSKKQQDSDQQQKREMNQQGSSI